jgi:hypothetical protein
VHLFGPIILNIAPLEEHFHNSNERSLGVMPAGGMPKTIYTLWNSLTHLNSKMATRGEKCRCSFDAIASPRPVAFPLSWKVVFFELWRCSSGGAILWCTANKILSLIFEYFSKLCHENSCLIKIRQEQWWRTWSPTYICDHISLDTY